MNAPLTPASALDFPERPALTQHEKNQIRRKNKIEQRDYKVASKATHEKREAALRKELAVAHNALRKHNEQLHAMRAALIAAGIRPANGEQW